MKNTWLLLLAIFAALTPAVTRAQTHTKQGAALGGVAGAITGAVIGKQNGETTEGALIGGALGLITGAAIGNAKDEQAARTHAIQQQYAYQQAHAVSTSDVVSMTHNGLREDLIINHIRQNGVQRRLQVADVISLHKQGVSENVITAMQQARVATAQPIPPQSYRAPVVVEERYYVAPRYYHRPYYGHRHYHHHHYHRPGVQWGVTIGQ